MSNTVSKLFSIFLVVILIFIYPIMHMAEQQENTARIFALTETTKFVDAIRDLGYISPFMYNEFVAKLSATNNLYDIDLEHRHKVYNPANNNSFNISYDAYYTKDILAVLFPTSNAGTDYMLSKDDYILVKVMNKNKTFATKLREMILGRSMGDQTIVIRYGGAVRFENY